MVATLKFWASRRGAVHRLRGTSRRHVMNRSREAAWYWDAPDPEDVVAHVEGLIAQETRLGGSDERCSSTLSYHEKLRKAADTYYTIFNQIVCESIPDSAYKVADVHKVFAEQVMRAEVPAQTT